MKKLVILFSFLFLASYILASDEVDVTGEWEITISTPRGDRNSTIEFKQTGEDLQVTMEGRQGDRMSTTGKVIGNKIEWSILLETQRGDFKLDYKGTVSGDQMKGEVQFGERGSGDWSAKKL